MDLRLPDSRSHLRDRRSGPLPRTEYPRSTIRSWIHRGMPDVISCDLAADDHAELIAQIEGLRHRTWSRATITDTCHCAPWRCTLSESGRSSRHNRRGIGWSERPAGGDLEFASTRQTQDRDPSKGSRRTPSSGRDDYPVARRNESVSAWSDRQLFPADPVLDT